jgi:hypothetical protein
MALNIAPYSQTHFQSLPSLNAARGSFVASNGNGLVNGVFKDFFINNNMERTFGLIMLHRHFDINPGEKTANYNSTFTVWNTKPGEGMGEPQPVIWGFSSEALVPLEFIYSKEHRFAISEKETSFIIKFKRLLEENGLVEMFGLCVYPGDDFEGSREITMGSVNINPKPNDVRQPSIECMLLTDCDTVSGRLDADSYCLVLPWSTLDARLQMHFRQPPRPPCSWCSCSHAVGLGPWSVLELGVWARFGVSAGEKDEYPADGVVDDAGLLTFLCIVFWLLLPLFA